jgi:hypothetical protein
MKKLLILGSALAVLALGMTSATGAPPGKPTTTTAPTTTTLPPGLAGYEVIYQQATPIPNETTLVEVICPAGKVAIQGVGFNPNTFNGEPSYPYAPLPATVLYSGGRITGYRFNATQANPPVDHYDLYVTCVSAA